MSIYTVGRKNTLWKIYLRSNPSNFLKIGRVLWKLWWNTFWCVFYAPQCMYQSVCYCGWSFALVSELIMGGHPCRRMFV